MEKRHRITIYNPLNTNDDLIESVNSTHLLLNSTTLKKGEFVREDKITVRGYTHPQLGLIKSIRIHVNDINRPLCPVFGYNYQTGLNVYVTPTLDVSNDAVKEEFYRQVSAFLKEIFGVAVSSDQFVISVNALYYHSATVPRITSFPVDLPQDWANVDLTYDGLEEKLIVKSTSSISAFSATSVDSSIEVGLFKIDDNISSADDLVLTGIRVLLEPHQAEKSLHKTLFHVKPRHRYLESQAETTVRPSGLHPVVETRFSQVVEPSDVDVDECKLYYYINLNRSLFVDKYQLGPDFQLVGLFGNSDLELPEYKIADWGTEVLLEAVGLKDLDLTLHSRYQLPQTSESTDVTLEKPIVFYACNVAEDEYLLVNSPFDNKGAIGGSYENFFTNDTVFYHFQLDQDNTLVNIPNGHTSLDRVNSITFGALGLGIVFLMYKLATVFLSGTKVKTATKEKKTQ